MGKKNGVRTERFCEYQGAQGKEEMQLRERPLWLDLHSLGARRASVAFTQGSAEQQQQQRVREKIWTGMLSGKSLEPGWDRPRAKGLKVKVRAEGRAGVPPTHRGASGRQLACPWGG